MSPLSLMSVSANVLLKSVSLGSVLRCPCVVPFLRNFSTSAGDPPKRPLTAYMKYVLDIQPTLIRQNPGVKNVDIVRKIAQQWRSLTPEQKQPFQDASSAAREKYKLALQEYKAQLTPAQTAAITEERKLKMAKRKAIRKKKELNTLGKPKRPRSAFNIFMAEHFEEARGVTMQSKMKSLVDDWGKLNISQKQIYTQLAEDDKVRYKNEMKSWEEHMIEIGREDLVRRKERRSLKAAANNDGKKSKVTVLKAKATKKKAPAKKTDSGTVVNKTVKSTKK